MCSKIISDGVSINYIPKDYKYYLNKSTILFGASGSGKSTILIEILYLLRKKFLTYSYSVPLRNQTMHLMVLFPIY